MSKIKIPNRAVPLTIVESDPINKNWDAIETSLNETFDLAIQVTEKIDEDEKGVQGGVATLDTDKKLDYEQLPEPAKGHVYETTSLSEQLQLSAFPGDICVRKDISSTFALKDNDPSLFSSWVEIGSVGGAGELVGNAPYIKNIKKEDWILGDIYYIYYDNFEHGQGNNQNLLVIVKNNYGESVTADYIVDEIGNVTIYSDYNFEGSIIITNLSGNSKNNTYSPYCVITGPLKNNLLSFSANTISLNCSPIVNIIDGFGTTRSISSSDETLIEVTNGRYILFIDSANIQNGNLTKLSYVSEHDYFGVVNELPNDSKQGQRCYKAFDSSYEYSSNHWVTKAFTPIGEFIIENGTISYVYVYNYNDNNVNINYNSNVFDNLYGSEIKGLELEISNDIITVNPGKCLGNKTIINLNSTLIKNCKNTWEKGNYNGCRNNQDWNENNTGWACIYLISNTNKEVDLIISFSENPPLPIGFINYRRIGYVFVNNETVQNMVQIKNKFYFEPVTYVGTISNDLTSVILDTPMNVVCILNYSVSENANLDFYYKDYVLYSSDIKNNTIEIPLLNTNLTYKGDTTGNITLKVLGFIDDRSM